MGDDVGGDDKGLLADRLKGGLKGGAGYFGLGSPLGEIGAPPASIDRPRYDANM